MKAAQGAAPVIIRNIALNKSRHQVMGFELVRAIGSGKKPTVIDNRLQLNYICSPQTGVVKAHLLHPIKVIIDLARGQQVLQLLQSSKSAEFKVFPPQSNPLK